MVRRGRFALGLLIAVLVAVPVLPRSDNASPKAKDDAMGAMSTDAPRVAVVEFDDRSHAHLDQLGGGVADKLASALSAGGARVIGQGDLDSWMQEAGVDPTSAAGLSSAARALGVDYVVSGVVESVSVETQTLDLLGIARLSSAQASVELSARLIDASGSLSGVEKARGQGKGETSLSLYFGGLFSSPVLDLCRGGLISEHEAYAEGELVSIGYHNGAASGWFGIEVYASDGTFVRWLGWRFVPREECETWIWNQRDALGKPVPLGIYTARLRVGQSLADAAEFQIRPGFSLILPSLDHVTVGTEAFSGDAVGMAIEDAIAQLAAALLPALLRDTGGVGELLPAREFPEQASTVLGQVAATFPDGRVSINIGSLSGVAVGDRFEVLAVADLAFDPATEAISSYEIVAAKGEIEIVEVREMASTGICVGDTTPSVGDLVRLLP